MKKHLKSLLSPIMMTLIFTAPQMIHAMEVEEENTVSLFPDLNLIPHIECLIFEEASKDRCPGLNFAGNLALVCTT